MSKEVIHTHFSPIEYEKVISNCKKKKIFCVT